jgi:hypothetical protein
LAVSSLGVGPARAAAPTTKPAKTQTWIGQVQRQGRHFDYVGQPCPVGTGMLCANYVANYRIVPQNPAAARALRQVAGGQARLRARFSPVHDRAHQGTLLAGAVEAWCPPGAMCAPPPGHTVKVDESANGSTVTVAPGDHVEVTLHSTYWQFNPSSDALVLAADGGPHGDAEVHRPQGRHRHRDRHPHHLRRGDGLLARPALQAHRPRPLTGMSVS